MRRDVVGDGRWRDAAGFQAEPAQWLDTQLMRAAACPARGAIPAMDVRRVRHRACQTNARLYGTRGGKVALVIGPGSYHGVPAALRADNDVRFNYAPIRQVD